MNVLYLGQNDRPSKYLADALVRLGHNVKLIIPQFFLPRNRLLVKWQWETGGLFLETYVRKQLISSLGEDKFDFILVHGGALVGPALVKNLKKFSPIVVNYNYDDPFSNRDRNLWRLYLKAVPYYDLLVVVRENNISEAYSLGAKKVLRVFRSADEIAHCPRSLTEEDHIKWKTDVLFVGTWMPERGPFMAALLIAGLPLSIYGNGWQKAKEWPTLKGAWKGKAIYGDDYAKAIQTAKISLGLLSKGNRDLHTTRSMEIPFFGGLLCGERTTEHLKLYQEGEEAVFWSDITECISICKMLLTNEERRKKIATKGRIRCIQNNNFNEALILEVISSV